MRIRAENEWHNLRRPHRSQELFSARNYHRQTKRAHAVRQGAEDRIVMPVLCKFSIQQQVIPPSRLDYSLRVSARSHPSTEARDIFVAQSISVQVRGCQGSRIERWLPAESTYNRNRAGTRPTNYLLPGCLQHRRPRTWQQPRHCRWLVPGICPCMWLAPQAAAME